MLFKDVIYLINGESAENSMGDPTENESRTPVFANKLTYRNNAFYQAMANGLRPQITFEIKEIEYNNQTKLEYESKVYKIIDVSPLKNENIGLICEGVVNNATT